MIVEIPSDLEIPPATRPFLGLISREISHNDQMMQGNARHYYSVGASALSVILTALSLATTLQPQAILDFGSGAGRVTRWMRAAFPDARLDVCDIRGEDVDFCANAFRASGWLSGTDFDLLSAPAKYDLIWVGSVITHISASVAERLIDKLLSWTNPSGMSIASFHGRFAAEQDSYIADDRWQIIKQQYEQTGFGYADYPNSKDYGISLTKPSWVARLIEQRPCAKLALMSERCWDDHHDVFAIQVGESR